MRYVNKDITTVETGIIAHGVNCQGRMGAGVALALKTKWPKVYEIYMKQPTGHDMLGTSNIFPVAENLHVANCYTQEYYGSDGKRYASPDAIRESLTKVYELADILGIDVYLPKIGAGLGGLDWELDVEPILNDFDSQYMGVETYICTINRIGDYHGSY